MKVGVASQKDPRGDAVISGVPCCSSSDENNWLLKTGIPKRLNERMLETFEGSQSLRLWLIF